MSSTPLKPGDRFGRYALTELLGKGGMGEVYRAEDTLLGRSVALKVLHPAAEGTGADPGASQGAARILREARAAAALTHPNAIAIYDVGELDGVPFLAMEFVAGKTLRAYVGHEGIALARRVRWLLDVASALGAAHRLGLVHRDVKPENVMVRDDGVIKVLDFGIARRTTTKAEPTAATEAAAVATLTASGVVVGTPFYMAPEQMRGEPLDGRADQFAWGVVAYELLTGALPWDRQASGLELVSQILSRDVEPPRSRNPAIGPVLDAVVRKALAKSAQWRFATMEDLAVEIEPDAAVTGTATGNSSKRRRVSFSDGELAATQMVPASGPSAAQLPSTRSQLALPRAPDAPPSNARGPRWIASVALVALVGLGAWLLRASRHDAVSAKAQDAGAPVGIASAAPPTSSNPEAQAAYAAAVQFIRDASMDAAIRDLGRAVTLDPTFAAAHLRRALLSVSLDASAHEAFDRANGLRANLSAHDRELLRSFEPMMGSPPKPREAATRLEEALTRSPGDPELLFYLGKARWFAGDWEAAAKAFDEALAHDPELVIAIRYKAYSLANAGQFDQATPLYRRCLELSPDATACAWDFTKLLGIEGACEEEERVARDQIARHETAALMHGRIAEALYARGSPEPAVLAMLRTEWRRAGDGAAIAEARDRASLEVLRGDFAAAAAHAQTWKGLLGDDVNDGTHVAAFVLRMRIALETSRTGDVADQVREYDAHHAAWPLSAFEPDGTITIEALAYRAGVMDRRTFAARRTAWLARNQGGSGLFDTTDAVDRWFQAYAKASVTPEDAREAVAALPDGPPSAFLELDSDEPVGEMYRLADHPDEAYRTLVRAAHACTALSAPFESTWAAFELAQLLEARGETDAACREYAVVLSRWERALPASRTAKLAKQRAVRLHCAP